MWISEFLRCDCELLPKISANFRIFRFVDSALYRKISANQKLASAFSKELYILIYTVLKVLTKTLLDTRKITIIVTFREIFYM